MSTVGSCCSGSAMATLPALWAAGAMPCLSNGSSFCVQGSAPRFACAYGSPSIGRSYSSLHYPSAMDSLSRSAPTCAKSWDVSGAQTLAIAAIATGLLTAVPANAFAATEPRGIWNTRDANGVYNLENTDPLMFFGLAGAGLVIVMVLYAITNRNGEGKNKAETTGPSEEANGSKTSVDGSSEKGSVSSPDGLSPAEIAAIELVEWLSTEEDDEPKTQGSNNGNGNGQGASLRAKAGVRIGDVSPSVFPPPSPVPPARTSNSGLGVGMGADFYHEPRQED